MLPSLTFVLGGAASGKSVLAERFILNSSLTPIYVATSQVWDDEMSRKVALHQDRRGPEWQTIEAATDLGPACRGAPDGSAILVDCATMWLTNVMLGEHDLDVAQSALLDDLAAAPVPVVVVSNEVGLGIVPDNALARRFREAQGRLNIALAAQADCVVHVVAGLPHVLRGTLP